MADSTTNLPTLSVNQAQKEVVQNAINDALSPASYWGRDFRSTAGLTWGYLGGVVLSTGSPSGYIRRPNGTLLLTANTINYVEADDEGTVTVNTVGFTLGATALYEIVVGASSVTSYEDMRIGGGGSGSGSGAVAVKDEGITVTSATTLNFTGGAITAVNAGGGQVDIDVPGGVGATTKAATWVSASAAIELPINDVYVRCPVGGVVQSVAVVTIGGPGSCVIDIRKKSYASFPPSGGDTICGGNKPTIVADIKYLDATLTGWTTSISAGDWLGFHLDSTSTFTAIFVNLEIN